MLPSNSRPQAYLTDTGPFRSYPVRTRSTVSKHLSCLRECGLVQSRALGRASLYSLTVPEELTMLFAAAERLLAATGDAVQVCPTYGTGSTGSTVRAGDAR